MSCSCRQQLRLFGWFKAPIGITETEPPHLSAVILCHVPYTALLHFCSDMFLGCGSTWECHVYSLWGVPLHWKLWSHLLTSVSSSLRSWHGHVCTGVLCHMKLACLSRVYHIYIYICFTCWYTEVLLLFLVVILVLCFSNFRCISSANQNR